MITWMLDVDGVLRNFDGSWKYEWGMWTGDPPLCDSRSWNQIEQAAEAACIDYEEAYDYIFRKRGFKVMALANPEPGHYSLVNYLKSKGDRVIIATHQSTPETRAGTIFWLKKWGLWRLADLVVFTGVKASIVADIYVDDRVETLLDLRERYPLAKIIAPVVPWNRRLFEGEEIYAKPIIKVHALSGIISIRERMDEHA